MLKKDVTIQIPEGLEARSVAMFVQVASKFNSNIYVEHKEKKVNSKSIMGMMSLGLLQGEEITLIADGDDEAQALNDLAKYISNNWDGSTGK